MVALHTHSMGVRQEGSPAADQLWKLCAAACRYAWRSLVHNCRFPELEVRAGFRRVGQQVSNLQIMAAARLPLVGREGAGFFQVGPGAPCGHRDFKERAGRLQVRGRFPSTKGGGDVISQRSWLERGASGANQAVNVRRYSVFNRAAVSRAVFGLSYPVTGVAASYQDRSADLLPKADFDHFGDFNEMIVDPADAAHSSRPLSRKRMFLPGKLALAHFVAVLRDRFDDRLAQVGIGLDVARHIAGA